MNSLKVQVNIKIHTNIETSSYNFEAVLFHTVLDKSHLNRIAVDDIQ